MAAKKRRPSPTKLFVKDPAAIGSFLRFGIYHRAAIADLCLKAFPQAKKLGDQLSIGAQCVTCMIANVEDLEKAYFALRMKAAGSKESFFRLYANTDVREPDPKQTIGPKERSARVIRREVRGMNLKQFQAALGLATFEEWKALGWLPGKGDRKLRKKFNDEIRKLRKCVIQITANRAAKRLMNLYNKSKHGSVVLHSEPKPVMYMIEKAYGGGRASCWVQCLPFEVKEESIKGIVDTTKSAALTMRALLQLYAREPAQAGP